MHYLAPIGKHFPRLLWLSLALHVTITIVLSLKPRVVTLMVGAESSILRATFMDNPATGQPLRRPRPSVQPQAEARTPPRVETAARVAEKPPEKRGKLAENSSPIEPSKLTTANQSVNAVPAVAARPSAPSKKKGKEPLERKKSPPSPLKGEHKAATIEDPRREAAKLDEFFSHLAGRSSTGSARSLGQQHCNQYALQIKNAIQANLITEGGYQGRSCEIALQLAEDGTIIRSEARQGDQRVCAAALRAVGITERVPKAADAALYERFKAVVISFEF